MTLEKYLDYFTTTLLREIEPKRTKVETHESLPIKFDILEPKELVHVHSFRCFKAQNVVTIFNTLNESREDVFKKPLVLKSRKVNAFIEKRVNGGEVWESKFSIN